MAFLPVILISAIWLIVVLGVLRWCRRSSPWAAEVVAEADRYVDNPEIEPIRVSRCAMEAAIAAKAHFGELKYNNANRVIVREFVAKHFRDTVPDMRAVDIVKHTPMAVQLALVPSQYELQAQLFANDDLVRSRRAAVSPPK
jgi:hypothetical protein